MKFKTTGGDVLDLPDPPAAVAAFLTRVQAAADDEGVTVGAFVRLAYGIENPIMDTTSQPGRAVVTAATFASPYYSITADLLVRKQLQQDARRFTMTVAEAAAEVGITESGVRLAITQHRLDARKAGSTYLIDPESVAAYPRAPRGPKAALRARIGSRPGVSFRIKGADVDAEKVDSAREGLIPNGWVQIAVLVAERGVGARFWRIEPSDVQNAIEHAGFYVRGGFTVVEQIRDEELARDRFAAVAGR